MEKHGIGEDNDNGERLIDFCAANDLVIGGTLVTHKNIHKLMIENLTKSITSLYREG